MFSTQFAKSYTSQNLYCTLFNCKVLLLTLCSWVFDQGLSRLVRIKERQYCYITVPHLHCQKLITQYKTLTFRFLCQHSFGCLPSAIKFNKYLKTATLCIGGEVFGGYVIQLCDYCLNSTITIDSRVK